MKRYQINPRVEVEVNPFDGRMKRIVESVIVEKPDGDWVRWSDVEKLREYLESQIPEKRIERLERMIGLVSDGKCPECGLKTRGYQPPSGLLAPEMWATLREEGIDPSTGHKAGCTLSSH